MFGHVATLCMKGLKLFKVSCKRVNKHCKSYLRFYQRQNHDLLRHTAVTGPDGNAKRSRLLQISNISVMLQFVVTVLIYKT